MNEEKWLDKLKLFLNKVLESIIPSKEDRSNYLDEKAMEIWSDAFTHESVSPTRNYEDLEYLGDGILKAVFPKYLMKRLPNLHKKEFTELNTEYMSKMEQARLARQMGLGDYIRVTGIERAGLNLETDVFESFIGALDTVTDMISLGMGWINCYNMIVYLFTDINIDETQTRIQGHSKTQVQQIFTRFDLPKPTEHVDDWKPVTNVNISLTPDAIRLFTPFGITEPLLGEGSASKSKDAHTNANINAINQLFNYGILTTQQTSIPGKKTMKVIVSVSLEQKHLDFLRSYDVNIENPIIGLAESPTKAGASYEAYESALRLLGSYGISTEWARLAKNQRDFMDDSVARYVPLAKNRLNKEGYIGMEIKIPHKIVTDKGAVVQLVGIREDGVEDILGHIYTSDRSNGYLIAKSTLVKNYAQNIPSKTPTVIHT